MTIEEMFGQSSVLTFFGMVTVVGFLWLIVLCVSLMGKVVHALGLDKNNKPAGKTITDIPANAADKVKPEIAAVITVAITTYQTERKDE